MWNSYIGKRILGFKYAFRGAWMLLKSEASIQVQVVVAIVMTFAGCYYELSPVEWVLQTLAIALVLGIEGLNTAIEELADFVHPDHHNKIGKIKDVAAGAVFFAAIAALIIGVIIYGPKI